jgi:predicted RNA binding protein YcfA (HicA-like mRNA interferase family)
VSLKNELRSVERELVRLQFVLVREGNHRIWRRADGQVLVTPKPHRSADPHAIKNLRAQVRRLQEGGQRT